MKKFVFVLVSFFVVSVVQAYEGFRCFPSLRETRIQVLAQNDEIQVLVNNGAGYDFMPQFEGPNSVFNLSFNKMQGEDLKDLADSFTFAWPKDQCKLDTENFTVSCRSEAKASVKSVKSFGITTTEILEKYEDEKYEKRKFRMSLEKDNFYFVSLVFDTKSCSKFN